MRLADRTTTLTLEVIAYEFPALRHDPYDFDANWLRVRLTLITPEGRSGVEGPYLLTWELASLADALEDDGADLPVFTEPNLRIDRDADGLRVRLRDEGDASYTIATLRLDAADRRRAARALRDLLTGWPRRYLRGA